MVRSPQSRRFVPNAVLVAVAIVPLVLVPACSDDAYNETKFGGTGGLASKRVPDPFYPGTAVGGGDGGTTSTATLCNGGPTVSDDKCVQKWSEIFTKYVKGTWKCTDVACHQPAAGGKPPFDPPISNDDAKKAWESLVAHKMANKRYLDPCTKTPENSAINCNLVGSCKPQMPETSLGVTAQPAVAAELDEVNKWLACGAPNN
jgi:hypothetical protein